jgi:hypothetical protein
MNGNFLRQSANAWVQQAKQDIANKIREFLNESGISLPQMANDLGLDINELNNILNGGAPSLMTFATLMIASGLVIELKPIEEANIPVDRNGMPIPQGPMPAGMPMPGMRQRPTQRPPHSMFDDFQRQPAPEPAPVQHQPRGANGRFQPWPKPQGGAPVPPPPGMRPAPSMSGNRPGQPANRPPFSQMDREELVQVVREHLWQNEIDLAHVDRDQLVRFLEDKDRQFAELRNEAVGIDPAVAQLKTKLKNVIEKNPHLVGYLKDIFEQ